MAIGVRRPRRYYTQAVANGRAHGHIMVFRAWPSGIISKLGSHCPRFGRSKKRMAKKQAHLHALVEELAPDDGFMMPPRLVAKIGLDYVWEVD